MRRRISILLASALAAAGFVMLGPSQPASAWVVCGSALGTANVNPGLLYPIGVTTPSKKPGGLVDVLIGTGNHISTFALAGITCVHQGVLVDKNPATGQVKGYCGLSSGSGRFANGDLFAWIGIGGTLIITGHVVGVVNAVPNPLTGQSCTHNSPAALTDGALEFLVQGAVIKLNCTANLQTLVPGTNMIPPETLIPLETETFLTPVPLVHVLIDIGLHYYWNHQCVGPPVL